MSPKEQDKLVEEAHLKLVRSHVRLGIAAERMLRLNDNRSIRDWRRRWHEATSALKEFREAIRNPEEVTDESQTAGGPGNGDTRSQDGG